MQESYYPTEESKKSSQNVFGYFFGSGVTYQSLANGSVFHSGVPNKKVLLTNFADNSKMKNIEK